LQLSVSLRRILVGVFLGAALVALPPAVGTAAVAMVWQVARHTDAESGAKSCVIISWGRDVTARLFKGRRAEAATWSVRVGYDNQPGSLRYLRIEKTIHTTDSLSFDGREAAEIVAQLKAPGVFAFEWAARPDSAKRQGLFGNGDFAAKAAECERWIGEIRI
jgi:hypothetical protein